VAILGVVLFHEHANALKAVAILLIIAGVVCLEISSRKPPRNANRLEAQSLPLVKNDRIETAQPELAPTNGVGAINRP